MAINDMFFWCVRAGATGDADDLFLKHNRIAVGWRKIGDLSALVLNKEALKIKVAEIYPDKKPGAIPGDVGMLSCQRDETGRLCARVGIWRI